MKLIDELPENEQESYRTYFENEDFSKKGCRESLYKLGAYTKKGKLKAAYR